MAVPGSGVKTRLKSASSTRSQIDRKSPLTANTTTTIIPSSLKSILLYDWWLVKADGGFAVGGFAFRERAGLRVFDSVAISKRREATILEATDGIIITVTGLINRSRTHENGFPPEVYNHFLLGFPFNWKDYVSSSSVEKSASESFKANTSHSDHESAASNQNLEHDLDDYAVTRFRDLLLSTYGESSNCIFMKSKNSKSNSLMENVESGLNETPVSPQKENSHQDHQEVDTQDNEEDDFVKDPSHTVQEAKSNIEIDFPIPSGGVCTRSMTRLESSRNKSKEPLLSDTRKKARREGKSCSSENSGRRIGKGVESSSNVTSTTNISIKADKEVNSTTEKAEGRRSSLRLRKLKQNQ